MNLALMKLHRRAEAADPDVLVETFVDAGPLFVRLSSTDHQILSGRRGTGKTHALTYLADARRRAGDLAVYVDLRRLGSTGGLYADQGVPITERGTRLLVDALEALHDELVNFALDTHEQQDVTPALSILDRLADEISRVVVVGEAQDELREAHEERTQEGGRLSAELGTTGPRVGAAYEGQQSLGTLTERTYRRTGVESHRVHFGAITRLLEQLREALPADRFWILLDEWSDLPLDLQPLLADLFRRAFFPVPGVTVKIGAIEQRSNFRVETPKAAISASRWGRTRPRT